MAAAAVGCAAAVPFGYDPFPLDGDTLDSVLLPSPFASPEIMTAGTPAFLGDMPMVDRHPNARDSFEQLHRPNSLVPVYDPQSDAGSSPGSSTHPSGAVGDQAALRACLAESTSPGTASSSLILTPASTLLEYHSSESDVADHLHDREHVETWLNSPVVDEPLSPAFGGPLQPTYSAAASTGAVAAGSLRLGESPSALMNSHPPWPPQTTPSASGVSSRRSPTRSVAPLPSTARPSDASWIMSDGNDNAWVDHPSHTMGEDPSVSSSLTFPYIDQSLWSTPEIDWRVPYLPTQSGPGGVATFEDGSHGVMDQRFHFPGHYHFPTSIETPSGPPQQPPMDPPLPPSTQQQPLRIDHVTDTIGRVNPRPRLDATSLRGKPYRPKRSPDSRNTPTLPPRRETPPQSSGSTETIPQVPNNDSQAPPQPKRKIGGRGQGSHLNPHSRRRVTELRKIGACWLCAIQRDPCDGGSPCNRCEMRSQRGQTVFFECDRSKLPDFVQEFLPPSMTLVHQKQSVEDAVSEQVLAWDHSNPVEIQFTCGYGTALRWRVYEFKPRNSDYLHQLQYLQDPLTGTSTRRRKWSPPFALLRVDPTDETHFTEYIDRLLEDDCLKSFGWRCFEEETQVDPDAFQARLLQSMCNLYMDTTDGDLQNVLQDILRMMVITYVMGHTLTIEDETLAEVLSTLKFSHPPQYAFMQHTSSRLANRQFKFFFSIMRNNIYLRTLHQQQQRLHSGNKKDSSWLPAFCSMLGFAMVLEEVQRTLYIQADAKVAAGEMPYQQATTEARNACERIDDRFRLIVGLFQYKYRDKRWGENGSFGSGTPRLHDHIAHRFLSNLYSLIRDKNDHLENRRTVELAPENQCRYTSRLVARFLLPFVGLPS